jgi:4-hydroxybenzoate polyprenyltransferase
MASLPARYLSLIKFSHTLFALPFACIGVSYGFLAAGRFDPWLLVCVLLCMVFARSAAMAFNRYNDREFDAHNPRTAIREIPSGQVSAGQALGFVVVNCIAFVATTWFINPLCFALSPVALAVVLGYSYTKRFTALCHVVLGIGLGLAPVGAYLAVTGRFVPEIIVLGCVVLSWVAGFDIIYALQDDEFDRNHGLWSIPSVLGRTRALVLSSALHVVSVGLLAFFGWVVGGGILFWLGFAVFSGLLLYQHQLVSPQNLSRVNLAFFTLNGIASVVFGVLVVADIYLRS